VRGAAVFAAEQKLGVLDDIPEPKLTSPDGVKLRVLQVGVCATDREVASFIIGSPPEGSDYLVMGHEALAEIVETGSEVSDLRPGDLVVPTVRRPCDDPACIACRNDRSDFCMTGLYLEHGIQKMHGFMTDFVVDEARYMRKVPPSMRDAAVLVEPLTVAEKAFIQAEQILMRLPWNAAGTPGAAHQAVVIGAGPVGLLGAMALRVRGCRVAVYSREEVTDLRAEIARAIGAEYVSSLDKTPEQMAAGMGNIDLVYEATGSPRMAFDAMHVLGRNGVLILTAIPGANVHQVIDIGMLITNMTLKNQCLLGTVNADNEAFDRAISDLEIFCARWPAAVRGLITGRFKLEQFATPIRNSAGIKNIIEMAS
jgi:threonine dehydrogenase-like Zn-dependent dehydrogenase